VTLPAGLRIAAALIVVCGLIYWAAAGANRGWTKTTRDRMQKDPITEIEYSVPEKHFYPGVDALAAMFLVAGALAISSLFVSRKNNT
jgi:hypothetical protein